MNIKYKSQVELLLDILPYVAKEECFALKGGTAINMFIWDMPRLSVDIDLTYINFDARDIAITKISKSLENIKDNIDRNLSGVKVVSSSIDGKWYDKLLCIRNDIKIKIEVNTTMRGIINQTNFMQVSSRVVSDFGKFAAIKIVSMGELFGGKICAALDRQHPRDLFDVSQLFEEYDDLTEEIKDGFIVSLLSHNKPIHELFRPNFQNQESAFKRQFEGMTLKNFTYNDFEETRVKLIKNLHESISEKDKLFLLSFKSGQPNWKLSSIEKLKLLPAVKWKLKNINILKKQNPTKHLHLTKTLSDALYN